MKYWVCLTCKRLIKQKGYGIHAEWHRNKLLLEAIRKRFESDGGDN